MSHSSRIFAGIIAASAIIAPQLAAQGQGAPASRYDPATFLLANVQDGTSKDTYLANLLEAFRAVDTDQNGLDRSDIARIDERIREEGLARRQQQIERYRREIEPMDANGDGGVTEREILEAYEYQRSGGAQVDRMFELFDVDRDGIIELSAIAPRAGRRAQEFAEADSNGDGSLDKEEALAVFAPAQPVTETPDIQFDRMDIDGNGIATAEEMAAQYTPDGLNPAETERRQRLFERLFVLDADLNDVLSEAELTSAFYRQFARVDANGDGSISSDEARAVRPLVNIARNMVQAPFCDVPSPGSRADVLAVLAKGGQLASSTAIGTQDRETSIVDVSVEPGDEPLYLMLLSENPVIWDFSGSTNRIEQIVVFSKHHDDAGNPLAGLIGVPGSKIVFGEADCMPFRKLGSFGPSNTIKLENLLGAVTRLPVRVAAGTPGSVFLPSLSVERFNTGVPAPEGFDPDVWWTGTDDRPRGIATPNPASIVTETSAEPYEILPGEFGLARLTYEGVIEPTEHDFEFRILQPLDRFPGSLQHSGRISFVLGEGIARPQGELGRGCLYAADGTTVLEGDYCTQYPRGNAVQIRAADNGETCLFRYGGENAGCFPDDGRALRAVETDSGQVFEPVPEDEVQVVETISVPEASYYNSPIEIIPAGLRQQW